MLAYPQVILMQALYQKLEFGTGDIEEAEVRREVRSACFISDIECIHAFEHIFAREEFCHHVRAVVGILEFDHIEIVVSYMFLDP